MYSINPYLNFNGNAEEAFNFYKSVFGGEFTILQRYQDAPHGEEQSAGDAQRIMHVSLPIGKETILMGSDVPENFPNFTMGTNFFISINTENEKETDKIFNALAAGGKINMPLDKTFWNAYFGMLTDKFGVQWMVNCEFR
jgi:PhnB protein